MVPKPDILSVPDGITLELADPNTVPAAPMSLNGDVTREAAGRNIVGELPATKTATSVVRTVKLPPATVRGGLVTHAAPPRVVSAADRSVKTVFHVAERMTAPGTAFSAPVGGVYTPFNP